MIAYVDYSCWVFLASVTIVMALVLLVKLRQREVKGFIPQLTCLIICESVCTLLFEIPVWVGFETRKTGIIVLYSVAIGGEVCFKSLSLWIFGIIYLQTSFQMPKFNPTTMTIEMDKTNDIKARANCLRIVKYVGILLIMILWVLIAVAQTLFDINGNFDADPRIVSLLEADYACSAAMSLLIASTIAVAIGRMWKSLAAFPQLRRNERIMWLHFIVIFSYAVTFISNSILVAGAARNYPDQIQKWVCAFQIQGIIQAWFSFFANVILLYLLNHFSKSMVECERRNPYSQRNSSDTKLTNYSSVSSRSSRSSARLSAEEMERYMSPEHTIVEVNDQEQYGFGIFENENQRHGVDTVIWSSFMNKDPEVRLVPS